MTEQIKRVIKNLEKNNMKGIYAENSGEAVKLVKDMLFENAVITLGGSMSVEESGVLELLKNQRYRLLDRCRPGITPEEQTETYKATIGGDFYFCSANALTENGELVNADGYSNRISAIAFGPQRVIVIAGKNKIVPDLESAFLRIKTTAAPKNCIRLKKNTPCVKSGKCISLLKNDNPGITDGCECKDRICRNYLVCGPQGTPGRITVIIVNEELGY